MKLLDEIIETLSSQDGNLNEALLKTKVLLHRIGKKDLVDWVNKELNGYPDDSVPHYRNVSCEVRADVWTPGWQIKSHPIPIAHLTTNEQKSLTEFVMRDSIATIEEALRKPVEGRRLIQMLPMEAMPRLSEGLAGGAAVQQAWCEINMRQVDNIIVQVRSRLLDFVLELNDGLGDVPEDGDLKTKAGSMDTTGMFNNAIFGPNTTILVGDHGVQRAQNTVTQGNLEELAGALTHVGIPPDEIEKLRQAITKDQHDGAAPSMDGETGTWYKNLLGRAAKGTLGVALEVVAGEGFKALAKYLGIGF